MSDSRANQDGSIDELLMQVLDADEDRQETALAEACERAPDLAEQLRVRWRALAKFGLAEPPAAGLPARIGDYRIERRLGRGGMGVVYEALHDVLGRRVALKCIRPELLADERTRERFRRETLALARLQHPGLCTLFEGGVADGQPFLALQFVEGETLEAQLARARAAGLSCWSTATGRDVSPHDSRRGIARSVREAVELVARLARAVDVMHGAGIVHRDLKPANVMVTTAGPVLIDFGLARDFADGSVALTISSDVVGTPAYMAPEQVEPRGRTADARTDVHALAAVLYECLTLRPPFLGVGRDDTYRRILHEEPVDVRKLQPAAGRDLAAVVHRALAKEPRARFASAADFADELDRLARGEPTRTRPPGSLRRVLAWCRQRPAFAASLATLILALSVGLVISLVLLRQTRRVSLAYESIVATAHDPARGAVLAATSLDLGGGEPARSALYEALTHLRQVQSWPLENSPSALAASPDGTLFAVGLWCLRHVAHSSLQLVGSRGEKLLVANGRTRSIHIDVAQDRILVIGHLPTAVLFDLDGELVAQLPGQPPEAIGLLEQQTVVERIPFGLIAGGIQGKAIWLVTRDGQVRLFDLDGIDDPPRCFHFPGAAHSWVGAARDAASGMIALGGSDGTVALLAADGTPRCPVRRVHDGPVRFVEFSPNGRSLLVAPGHVRVWSDIDDKQVTRDFTASVLGLDGRVLHTLRGHDEPITAATWSPDGDRVLTTSEDATARIWAVASPDPNGAVPCRVLSHHKPVNGGFFFADGGRVLTRMDHADPLVWDEAGQRLGELRGHVSGCWVAAPIGAGAQLVTGTLDKRLLRWDTRSEWYEEWRLPERIHAAFWVDDRTILTKASGLQSWRLGQEQPREVANPGPLARRVAERVMDPSVSLVIPHGDHVLEIDRQGELIDWGPAGEQRLLPVPSPDLPATYISLASAAVDPTTRTLAVGGSNGDVLVLDAAGTLRSRHDLKHPRVAVMGIGWLSDSSLLVAMSDGPLLRIDASGAISDLGDLGTYVFRLAMAPDRRIAAIADGNCRVHIVDAVHGTPLLRLPPMAGAMRTLAFSPDGRHLMVAAVNGDLRVWPIWLDMTGSELLASSPYQQAIELARAGRRLEYR